MCLVQVKYQDEVRFTVVQDELLLLSRARAFDQEALAQIHDLYYVPIFRYISLQVADAATAEDLTSEVFIRLLHALRDHTAPQNSIRGWLFSVASIVVKDFYRKQYRAKQTELDENLPSQLSDVDITVDKRLIQQKLQTAITQLTEEQRNVIALRFGYDMPIEEVAKTIGKTIGSVKMLQARAVVALSRLLNSGDKK